MAASTIASRAATARWAQVPALLDAAALAAPWGAGMDTVGAAGSLAGNLVTAAMHEAGHAMAARAFGFHPTIEIWPTGKGRCTFAGPSAITTTQSRVIGLAGCVAELIARRGALNATADMVLRELLHGPELSISDAAMAGRFTDIDLHRIHALVTDRWRVVATLARHAVADFLENT